ncbi:chain length determinant protein EpsF [Nitrosomonas marina]|uniref:Chain length determinant protein EpsF n=1 Tax=Nitrosomonas marina TaxID=917 RepID=A0A1H8HQ01_9PROT|nr:chain length determinant protein EpsF [Nitrosomonas marina]SEN57996.1 chain length determinant protein EpsF [Nitrosomonas marina]
MNFLQLTRILQARFKIVLFVLLLTVLTTLCISILLPKSFKATTTVMLTSKGVDPVTGHTIPVQLMHGFMATQLDIITSNRTALMVVDQLKLDQHTAIKQRFEKADGEGSIRDWLASMLVKNLHVEPSRESNVISISFKGSDREFVAAVANAFARAYQEMNIRLSVEPSQQASVYLSNQLQVLREKLQLAQKKVSRFQQEEGIVDVDNRLDVETRRLNELSSKLTLAQSDVMGSGGERSDSNTDGGHSLVNNTLINGLKVNLVQAEAKLADTQQRLGKNHPEYEGVKAQVAKIRAELAKHTKITTQKALSRETEIRDALENQKTKVLALQQARNELKLLLREAEGAQHAYDSALQHLNRTSLEGRSDLSSVSILDPATIPASHDSPNLQLNLVVSVFLGSLLGIVFSLLAEMTDRRIRSAEDLVDVLQTPILGSIDLRSKITKRSRWSFLKPAHKVTGC